MTRLMGIFWVVAAAAAVVVVVVVVVVDNDDDVVDDDVVNRSAFVDYISLTKAHFDRETVNYHTVFCSIHRKIFIKVLIED